MTITKTQLAEWRAKTGAAVKGVLTVYANGELFVDEPNDDMSLVATFEDTDEANFFKSAREAMPLLMDEVERLRDVLLLISDRAPRNSVAIQDCEFNNILKKARQALD